MFSCEGLTDSGSSSESRLSELFPVGNRDWSKGEVLRICDTSALSKMSVCGLLLSPSLNVSSSTLLSLSSLEPILAARASLSGL